MLLRVQISTIYAEVPQIPVKQILIYEDFRTFSLGGVTRVPPLARTKASIQSSLDMN